MSTRMRSCVCGTWPQPQPEAYADVSVRVQRLLGAVLVEQNRRLDQAAVDARSWHSPPPERIGRSNKFRGVPNSTQVGRLDAIDCHRAPRIPDSGSRTPEPCLLHTRSVSQSPDVKPGVAECRPAGN